MAPWKDSASRDAAALECIATWIDDKFSLQQAKKVWSPDPDEALSGASYLCEAMIFCVVKLASGLFSSSDVGSQLLLSLPIVSLICCSFFSRRRIEIAKWPFCFGIIYIIWNAGCHHFSWNRSYCLELLMLSSRNTVALSVCWLLSSRNTVALSVCWFIHWITSPCGRPCHLHIRTVACEVWCLQVTRFCYYNYLFHGCGTWSTNSIHQRALIIQVAIAFIPLHTELLTQRHLGSMFDLGFHS